LAAGCFKLSFSHPRPWSHFAMSGPADSHSQIAVFSRSHPALSEYCVTNDPSVARQYLSTIHTFLSHESYWNRGVSLALVEKAVQNSIPFCLLHQPDSSAKPSLAGFARVVSDCAAIGYLGDVFVLAPHRKLGLGKFLVGTIVSLPELSTLRAFNLMTADAQSFYEQFGFKMCTEEDFKTFMSLRRSLESASKTV